MESNSYFFYNCKKINIKLMNGDIYPIEINEFDYDENSILNKIFNYDDKYRLRKHRMKVLKEGYEDRSFKEIVQSLENEDVLFIYSEPPTNVENCVNKYFNIESNDPNEKRLFNYFNIKNIENYYDTIDILYFDIYNKDLPLFFNFNYEFFDIGYSQIYIDILIKSIFEKQDITKVFFNFIYKVYKSSRYTSSIIHVINNLEKYYRDLDTIYIDISGSHGNELSLDEIYTINKLFDKISSTNTKNIHINSFILNKRLKINLFNTENIYIFGQGQKREWILNNFKSYNNNIFINNNLNINDYNCWIKKETYYNIYNNEQYNLYKHISAINYDELFNNYSNLSYNKESIAMLDEII
jgi:hypothetical protein